MDRRQFVPEKDPGLDLGESDHEAYDRAMVARDRRADMTPAPIEGRRAVTYRRRTLLMQIRDHQENIRRDLAVIDRVLEELLGV